MRRHGVLQAFGVVLGPEPTPAARLEAEERARETPSQARRRERIDAARQAVRDRLGVAGMSDEAIDRYVDPAVFED